MNTSKPTMVDTKRVAAELAKLYKTVNDMSNVKTDDIGMQYARALGMALASIKGMEIALDHWTGLFIGEKA